MTTSTPARKDSSYIEVHGRKYNLPTRPTIAICVDGFDPEYLEQGAADGILPEIGQLLKIGFCTTADCVMPSFTNPNNCSIVTGAPTSVHGIAGNSFLDKETGEEHMVVDDSLLRGTTILEQLSKLGVRIAAVTAKDKLRKIIGHGLRPENGAICFSSEKASHCTKAEHGIEDVEEWIGRPAPAQYSGDLSMFVLDVGVKLLEEDRAELFYLTLSDFIQHHHAPGSEEANAFMQALDERVGKLIQIGAVVALTGDHGMSDKCNADGTPNVLFLEDALSTNFTPGTARVICPITDPFVKHHGALGSFVRVHLRTPAPNLNEMLDFCRSLPQVELVLDAATAASRFEMPLDREGDFIVVAKKNAVIGSTPDEHDMAGLSGHRLRSHGGLSEQKVPLILSEPLATGRERERSWRNFDIYDLLLNNHADGEMTQAEA